MSEVERKRILSEIEKIDILFSKAKTNREKIKLLDDKNIQLELLIKEHKKERGCENND